MVFILAVFQSIIKCFYVFRVFFFNNIYDGINSFGYNRVPLSPRKFLETKERKKAKLVSRLLVQFRPSFPHVSACR
jgi:hypothetical protein